MGHVVIVGAGQAGASCAARLRSQGFDGAISMFGDEQFHPYQRPPLSKSYLLGDIARDRLLLGPPSFYTDHDINLRLGQRVSGIEPGRRCITVSNDTIEYDDLVLATGSNPCRLPGRLGGTLRGAHVIRTIADIDALRMDLDVAERVLVVGGGYVGLEASAVARKMGKDVTLIEMAPRILQRVACQETSDFFRYLHQDNGVHILESVGLTHLIGSDQVTGAKLDSGVELVVDTVIVGIGIDPEISLGLTSIRGLAILLRLIQYPFAILKPALRSSNLLLCCM